MLIWDRQTGDLVDRAPQLLCSFGITEAIAAIATAVSASFAGAGAAVAGGLGLADATLGGFTAGSLIGTGLEGAAGGALLGGGASAIEGKPVLTGALEGGAAGGLTAGLGPAVGGFTGLGTVAGDALTGAAVGAGSSAISGGNPLAGAAEGGVGGLITGAVSGIQPAGAGGVGGGTAVGGPGASAGGIAAPASIGADLPLEGPTADGATSDAASALQGPPASGQPLGSALGGASLDGATAGFDVPGGGTPLAAQDSAALGQSVALGQAGGTANQASIFGIGDSAETPATSPGAGTSIQDVNTFPVPPQPPMLDAGGNPALDATGNPVFSTPGQATYQGAYNTAAQENFANPAVADSTLAGATAAPGGNSVSNFLEKPGLGTLGTAVSNNSALLLGGAALGYDAIKANSPPAGLSNISTEANQLSAQATQLQSYLQNGTLPPGVQTSLHQAGQQAAATIRSQYAARGMSGSSAEAADLANVQNTIVSQGANIATQLLQTGISEAGLSSQLYEAIMNESIQSDAQLGTALATLASATARPSITLKAA